MSKNNKRVLLVGYFGFGNIGDDTALRVITGRLRVEGIEYTVYGEGVGVYKRVFGITAALKGSRAVIFAGGNLLQNETSNRSLLYYLRIIALAHTMNVPVFFAASGIGALHGVGMPLTSLVLPGVKFFGARTTHDTELAKALGINASLIMPDVCFTMPTQVREKKPELAYIPLREDKETERKIADIAGELSLSPTIIPLHYERDFAICKRIAVRLKARLSVFDSIDELMGMLSECRFTVSQRLHGAIFSILSHTTAFLCQSSEKCRALTADIRALSQHLGASSPLFAIHELNSEKIKELGAYGSEFDKLLNYLRKTSYDGLSMLCSALRGED